MTRLLCLASLCGIAALPCAAAEQDASRARVRNLLLSAATWTVHWSPADEAQTYVAVVRFRAEGDALYAASAHPDSSQCYPDVLVYLQADGFLFFGCTGVPKAMRHDRADPAAPFKGRVRSQLPLDARKMTGRAGIASRQRALRTSARSRGTFHPSASDC